MNDWLLAVGIVFGALLSIGVILLWIEMLERSFWVFVATLIGFLAFIVWAVHSVVVA